MQHDELNFWEEMKMTVKKCAEKIQFEEMKNIYERPLTAEEAAFAADNLALVWWYLKQKELRADDWFDVVIFRYLLSVKRWHTQIKLRDYSFSTIAIAAMNSAVVSELKKQKRRLDTISLSTPVPGAEGLVLEDFIAA